MQQAHEQEILTQVERVQYIEQLGAGGKAVSLRLAMPPQKIKSIGYSQRHLCQPRSLLQQLVALGLVAFAGEVRARRGKGGRGRNQQAGFRAAFQREPFG